MSTRWTAGAAILLPRKPQKYFHIFCLGLDIRVSQIMNPNALHAGRLCAPVHLVMKVMLGDSEYPVFLF